jgi:hypothetical protein
VPLAFFSVNSSPPLLFSLRHSVSEKQAEPLIFPISTSGVANGYTRLKLVVSLVTNNVESAGMIVGLVNIYAYPPHSSMLHAHISIAHVVGFNNSNHSDSFSLPVGLASSSLITI